MKRVRRQLDIRLKDIQDAVHEKYVVDISKGKASRAREKAQEAFDGAHTAQFNQLWEYCDELRRCSPGSIILMKVHTYNNQQKVWFLNIYCLLNCVFIAC